MNRSLLASDDVDTILLHAEVHFPFTFNYQLALVISARIRKDVPKEKKLEALWSMIGSFRKRNKDYCTAFATIVALSLMGGATSDSVIVFLQKMGVSVGKTSVLNEMRSIKAQVDNSASWLATEKYLCAWIDNLQYILPVKVQSEGRANNEVAGTSRLMLRVKEYVPPDMVAFETREGQPEISYEDQNIPAPIGMPPVELFNNEMFAKLISHSSGIPSALEDKNLREILAVPEAEPLAFDLQMPPTSGERSRAHLKILRRGATYCAFWQFLSCDSTLKGPMAARGIHNPITSLQNKIMVLLKCARGVEFNNARNLLAEITRKWYSELDEESETFLFPASACR